MTFMTKITKGHIITQNLDGTDHLDCLYRISLKALIYNNAGQILVVKEIDRMYWDLPGGGMDFGETIELSLKRELLEEVGYKGDLRYQLFDASEQMYIERLDANQICFYCRVWPENFDFIPGEEGDEIMFIDPEELLLQKSEVDAPARAYGAHEKWQELYNRGIYK
jgi:hydrolase, NUDIX family